MKELTRFKDPSSKTKRENEGKGKVRRISGQPSISAGDVTPFPGSTGPLPFFSALATALCTALTYLCADDPALSRFDDAERTVVFAGSFMTTCQDWLSVIQLGKAAITFTQLKPWALRYRT